MKSIQSIPGDRGEVNKIPVYEFFSVRGCSNYATCDVCKHRSNGYVVKNLYAHELGTMGLIVADCCGDRACVMAIVQADKEKNHG